MWKKTLHIFLNKYLITSIAFLIWLIFFDSNNVVLRIKLNNQLRELEQEKQFYLDEIRNDSLMTRRLLNDTAELERIAREKYLMKKPGEDVFLVIDTGK